MAEKISVQIALEGGAAVERQLESIGEAGQKAFNDLAKSAEQVGGFKNLNTEQVTQQLKAAGVEGKELTKTLQAVGTAVKFEKLVTGVQSAEAALLGLGRAAAVAGVAAAAAFAAMVKPTIAFADAINKASDQAVKLGLSLEQFRGLQSNLEKLGVSGDAAASGYAKFRQELEKAAQVEPGSQLAAFGLTAEAVQRQLDQFLQRLRQMPDGLARTNLAISQLGEKAGTQFIQGLRAAEGSMSADERKAYDLGQAIEQLSSAWAKFGSLTLAPTLTQGINAATTAVNALNKVLGDLQQIGQSQIGQQIGTTLQQSFSGLDQIIANVVGGIAQGMGASQQQVEALKNSILGIGQAGAEAGQQAAQGFQVWNEQLGIAVPATQQVAQETQGAGAAVADFISQIGQISWDAISGAGVAAWNAITGAIQNAISKLLEFIGKLLEFIGLKPQAPATAGGAAGLARGGLIGGRGTGTSDSNLAWLSRGEYVTPARVARQPGVLSFLEALRRSGHLPGYAAGGLIPGFQEGGDVSTKTFKGSDVAKLEESAKERAMQIIDALRQISEQLRAGLQGVFDQADQSLFSVANSVENMVNEILRSFRQLMGLRGGGLLGGRGTGTSDSNLAWVSRGEHIMPARAVAQPGVLSFLEALRRSGGNLSAVLDGMGRFALGGLVPRGGALGGMSHVTINFPGTPPISGLRASADVVDQLQRAAALAQVRSGGRKPSRYS